MAKIDKEYLFAKAYSSVLTGKDFRASGLRLPLDNSVREHFLKTFEDKLQLGVFVFNVLYTFVLIWFGFLTMILGALVMSQYSMTISLIMLGILGMHLIVLLPLRTVYYRMKTVYDWMQYERTLGNYNQGMYKIAADLEKRYSLN